MHYRFISPLILISSALAIAACGSSGGTDNPPAPPAPVTPPAPPPPPEPTFEERLQEWADLDPNGCRAQTPGFEAFGGWIKDNRSELGESRVWLPDRGEDLSDPTNHGANVWRVFSTCAVRSDEDRYLPDITGSEFWAMFREDGRDAIVSRSGVTYPRVMEIPEPGIWGEHPCQGLGAPTSVSI